MCHKITNTALSNQAMDLQEYSRAFLTGHQGIVGLKLFDYNITTKTLKAGYVDHISKLTICQKV